MAFPGGLSGWVYGAAWAVARPLLGAAALVHGEARRAVRGRRASRARFEAWGASERDPSRPLVWVHAPSVGEGLMAQATIAALRDARPDVQVAFTHFSPSAERIAETVGADVAGYSPWDRPRAVRRVVRALRPSVVVFVRTEVWPMLAREARRSGARVALVNAVLSETSGRMRGPGRRFLAPVYAGLDAVGAVSADHGARYERLGVPAARVRVTGDARFDQVVARIEGRAPSGDLPAILALLGDDAAFTVVAGSTWRSDDQVLVPALGVLRNEMRLRVVIAPHEPTPAHLRALEERLDRAGLRHARLGALLAAAGPATGVPVRVPAAVVIDRLGVLADLYRVADLAYVGGGFRGAGLHSVVEPAALGVPVLFGPGHGNAREAPALAAVGGGFVVQGAGDVEARIRELAGDRAALEAAGAAAASSVRAQTGAAARNATLILSLLDGTAGTFTGTRSG